MGKRAARKYDAHICPGATPGTPAVPHVGGPVTGGCLTVYIDGQPAARVGDACFCVGEPDTIITGSSGVYIGGQPAARMGDLTAHGGKIISGCRTVLIGEIKGVTQIWLPKLDTGEEFKEPSEKEKIVIINQAIADCEILLEKKLKLLKSNEFNTLVEFKKWFGKDDEASKQAIIKRIKLVLRICRKLTIKNFSKIINETKRKSTYAIVYPTDKEFRIFLGDPFWKSNLKINRSKAGVLIHEISHFKAAGRTVDDSYGKADCLKLAKKDPDGALKNADSLEFFIDKS